MAFQILPAETKFYDWFEKGSANLLRAAQLLHDLIYNYERPEEKLGALTEVEHQGDFIVHEIRDLLRKLLMPLAGWERSVAREHAGRILDILLKN